nr:MAG TPA: hypothetical protein [Caudoviricetes sp.]DAZ18175.1 MAG TPA: hypothetical protein [Caudoviricetes sp.]
MFFCLLFRSFLRLLYIYDNRLLFFCQRLFLCSNMHKYICLFLCIITYCVYVYFRVLYMYQIKKAARRSKPRAAPIKKKGKGIIS